MLLDPSSGLTTANEQNNLQENLTHAAHGSSEQDIPALHFCTGICSFLCFVKLKVKMVVFLIQKLPKAETLIFKQFTALLSPKHPRAMEFLV